MLLPLQIPLNMQLLLARHSPLNLVSLCLRSCDFRDFSLNCDESYNLISAFYMIANVRFREISRDIPFHTSQESVRNIYVFLKSIRFLTVALLRKV